MEYIVTAKLVPIILKKITFNMYIPMVNFIYQN